jgi:uncharacterized membrane protein YqjE
MSAGNAATPPRSEQRGLLDVAGEGLRQVGECVQARIDLAIVEAQAAGRRFLSAFVWSLGGVLAACAAFVALQFCIFLTLIDALHVGRAAAAGTVFMLNSALAAGALWFARRNARRIGLPQTQRALIGEPNA